MDTFSVFKRPAVFVSCLSPGYIAGGSQCTLAFMQAIRELHHGKVIYLGPNWLASPKELDVENVDLLEIGPRARLNKLWHFTVGDSADRISPIVRRVLSKYRSLSPVVYFNGDAVGAAVGAARSLSLKSVFIPHNFAPEYIVSEGPPDSWVERRRRNILSRAALRGFSEASARVCLSNSDRDAYLHVSGLSSQTSRIISPAYFSYRIPVFATSSRMRSDVHTPMILINTNLALKANIEGVVYFLDKVFPHLSDVKGLRVVVAGRAPCLELINTLKNGKAELVTRPEPAQMDLLFSQATLCLAIAFRGSGIKLRVAEALRRGVPVVATEHCARGYENVSPRVLKIVACLDEMVGAVRYFLSSFDMELANYCRKEHEHHFGFDAGVARLRLLDELLSDRAITGA